MGVTISFRGGKVPEKVVAHIVDQLEEKYKREGYQDCNLLPEGTRCERGYWRVDELASERKKSYLAGQKVSKERSEAEWWERDSPGAVERFEADHKRDLPLPDDFQPSRQKGICLNPHPKNETFCIRFTQDDSKDEWRLSREMSKTQYAPESVHVELCEYLQDVKKKMQKAGSDLKINDEGEYCDDDNPTEDIKQVEKNIKDNWEVINSVGRALAESGWEVTPAPPLPPTPEEQPKTGGLEDWMALRQADLLLTLKRKELRKMKIMPRPK